MYIMVYYMRHHSLDSITICIQCVWCFLLDFVRSIQKFRSKNDNSHFYLNFYIRHRYHEAFAARFHINILFDTKSAKYFICTPKVNIDRFLIDFFKSHRQTFFIVKIWNYQFHQIRFEKENINKVKHFFDIFCVVELELFFPSHFSN